MRKKEIIRVKKGLYTSGKNQNLPVLANLIYGPSYISKEMALSLYGMIPERVYEVTSMTVGKTKKFETPVSRFSYQHLSLPYYSEGIIRWSVENQIGFLIASKEKAICDLIYSKNIVELEKMAEFLREMRIEREELRKLKPFVLKKLANLSRRSSLELLANYLEKNR